MITTWPVDEPEPLLLEAALLAALDATLFLFPCRPTPIPSRSPAGPS